MVSEVFDVIDRSRRALILVPADQTGGAEKILRLVAEELLARRFEVDLVCLVGGARSQFSGLECAACHVIHLSARRELFGVFLALLFFFRVRFTRGYRVAFASHVHCNAFLSLLRKLGLVRTDLLVCRESTLVGRRFTGLRLRFYRFCYWLYGSVDRVVCQTPGMREHVLALVPVSKQGAAVVVPNPIAPVSIVRTLRPRTLEPHIVSVGRLINEKGFDLLIEAFSRVRMDYPGATLTIYGDGPVRDSLERLIEDGGLQSVVSLPGFACEPLREMQLADLCVVSSRCEGFPNTLLEMISVNSRVVATDCADGISDMEGIVVCEPFSAIALQKAMLDALASDTSRVGEKFDLELARRSPAKFVSSIFPEIDE